MFLLRRRSDGLYYKNNGRRRWRSPKEWTSDMLECTPFRSKVGAINSGGAVLKTNIKNVRDGDWNKPGVRDTYHKQVAAWYSEANRPVRMKVFHEMYEIVPVEISIKDN